MFGMDTGIAAMESDTAFVKSRLHSLGEEAHEQTMASGTTGFEENLAALRLGGISEPLMEVVHSCAEHGMAHTSGVAVGEDEIRLQPQSRADTIDMYQKQLQSSELSRFDSTSSMGSLMTDSIFSAVTTTDSCPPSPSSSAHVAEPFHCGSWNLNPCHVPDTPRRANGWSALRTGCEKSGMYVHDWSLRCHT